MEKEKWQGSTGGIFITMLNPRADSWESLAFAENHVGGQFVWKFTKNKSSFSCICVLACCSGFVSFRLEGTVKISGQMLPPPLWQCSYEFLCRIWDRRFWPNWLCIINWASCIQSHQLWRKPVDIWSQQPTQSTLPFSAPAKAPPPHTHTPRHAMLR